MLIVVMALAVAIVVMLVVAVVATMLKARKKAAVLVARLVKARKKVAVLNVVMLVVAVVAMMRKPRKVAVVMAVAAAAATIAVTMIVQIWMGCQRLFPFKVSPKKKMDVHVRLRNHRAWIFARYPSATPIKHSNLRGRQHLDTVAQTHRQRIFQSAKRR